MLEDVRLVLDPHLNLVTTRKLDDASYNVNSGDGQLKLTIGLLIVG